MLKLFDRAKARFPATDNFKLTESLLEEIKADLKSTKNTPVRIASRLGVPIALVRFVINETPSPVTAFTVLSTDGWGRDELRDFIVTRKAASGEWPKEDQYAIDRMREEYDEGRNELAQGRDGDFIIQYAFPRHKPLKRRHPYFVEMELEHD